MSGRGSAFSFEAVDSEQLRQGADHIKIMVSGGVASPYDPLDSLQYSPDEIRAAVEEATAFKRYVCAHAYPANAIARAVECGVRVIEHGNLIDAPTAKLMAKKGAFLVPTLVAYDAIHRHAADFGMGPESLEKNKIVLEAGLRSLELAKRAGVPMAFGSDLLGQLQPDQSKEFLLRSEALSAQEIIHSATIVGAELSPNPRPMTKVAPATASTGEDSVSRATSTAPSTTKALPIRAVSRKPIRR